MLSSHFRGETAIRIDSYPTGELFLTHTHTPPIRVASAHLWYNSGPNHGYNQRRTIKDTTNLPGSSGLEPALGLMPLSLHTSLLPLGCVL